MSFRTTQYNRAVLASDITLLALLIKDIVDRLIIQLLDEIGSDALSTLLQSITKLDSEQQLQLPDSLDSHNAVLVLRSICYWHNSDGNKFMLYIAVFLIQSIAVMIASNSLKSADQTCQMIDASFDEIVLNLLKCVKV